MSEQTIYALVAILLITLFFVGMIALGIRSDKRDAKKLKETHERWRLERERARCMWEEREMRKMPYMADVGLWWDEEETS